MTQEQVAKMIEDAVAEATAPLKERIEKLERKVEILKTDINILKQGGNL